MNKRYVVNAYKNRRFYYGKYDLRIKARELRRKGISVKQIAEEFGIAKGSASIRVRDIILSVERLETLRESSLKGAE